MNRLLCTGILVLGVAGCSSTEEGDTPGDGTAGNAGGSVTMTMDASTTIAMNEAGAPADHSVANTVDTGAVSDAKPSVSDAPKIVDVVQVDAPMACVKYCSCMAKWCADKVFSTGCLVECTRQSNWDLPCRANMCNLVDPQPKNDHCTHAFGVGQCTDN